MTPVVAYGEWVSHDPGDCIPGPSLAPLATIERHTLRAVGFAVLSPALYTERIRQAIHSTPLETPTMQNTCPNPGCGAMYNLTSQHVGRSFACKKCGATLVVGDHGLELAGGGDAAEPMVASSEDPTPMRRPTRMGSGGAGMAFKQFWERVKADSSTWLFGLGAFFTIICLFFPLLDQAKVLRREVAVSAGDRREHRLDEELNRKKQELQTKNESLDKLKGEIENRKKAADKWRDVDKPALVDEIGQASDSAKGWQYWYNWGMMWGFLFLAFAALGYLTPKQPTIRRVVGSIIICAMILLIFLKFVFGPGVRV